MNWGMIPFLLNEEPKFNVGDYIYIPNIKNIIDENLSNIPAYIIGEDVEVFNLHIAEMTSDEKSIVKAGCLINHNKNKQLSYNI
jgi:aconitate hydratase